jgi:hypothetical protein
MRERLRQFGGELTYRAEPGTIVEGKYLCLIQAQPPLPIRSATPVSHRAPDDRETALSGSKVDFTPASLLIGETGTAGSHSERSRCISVLNRVPFVYGVSQYGARRCR